MRRLFGQPLTGWRLPATVLAASIRFLTIIPWVLLAVEVVRTSSGPRDQGLSAIFDGDCGSAKTLLDALRLVICVTSSLVLLSSNYFMQLVVAPSREDVERTIPGAAHRSRVPSKIRRPDGRAQQKASARAPAGARSKEQKLKAWKQERNYSNISSSSWFAGFCGLHTVPWAASGMISGVNLEMESRNGNDTSVSVLSDGHPSLTFDQRLGYQWIDDMVDDEDNWIIKWHARGRPSGATLLNETLTVEYCLSEPMGRVCRVRINKIIFLTVGIIALGKSYLCVAVLNHVWRTQPLATIGDAVDSFIRRPDPATSGMCTFGQRDFSRNTGWKAWRNRTRGWTAGPRRWETRRRRWGDAVRVSDWLTAYSVGIAGFVLGALALGSFIGGAGGWHAAISWGTCGQDPDNPVFYMKYPSRILEEIIAENASDSVGAFLLVNTPQLGISITILGLNAIYTRVFMAKEWASYSRRPKPLRVSIPRGRQRSNHVLQIPLPYAVGIRVICVLAHWLCANAVYVTFIESYEQMKFSGLPYRPEGSYKKHTNILLSFKAAMATMIVFFVMLLFPFVAAWFRLPAESVLVGSCSAAISAACHALQPSSQTKGASITPRAEPVPEWNLPGTESYRLEQLGCETLPDADAADGDEMVDWRTRMAEGELKWGVVTGKALPATRYDESADDLLVVEHLSFGTTENAVHRVRDGAFYAGVAEYED